MSDSTITAVLPALAFDSRGNPTVSCEIQLASGAHAQAIVPSGASTGTYEAKELRDGDDQHFGGKGVRRALDNVATVIAPAVIGRDSADQAGLDDALEALDGTEPLGVLGANAVLSVSIAAALAAAHHAGVPPYRWFGGDAAPLLPVPMVNIISGGAHAGHAVDVQDFLVTPLSAGSFAEAIEQVWRVRAGTREVLARRGFTAALVADEGGFGEQLTSNVSALDVLCEGIEVAGLRAGEDVAICLDIAANELLDGERYRFTAEDRRLDADELVAEIAGWCQRYPIVSVEDVLADGDWAGWQRATSRLGKGQLLGDDLFVTKLELLQRGIDAGIANAVLVKPNQAGTLSRARRVVELAKSAGYATVLSARSGDTEDSWLADLAVGWRTGQIKVGSLTRSERLAKWNRLLRIETELGDAARYAGATGEHGLLIGAR